MNKNLFIIVIMIVLCRLGYGQDIINQKDGRSVEAKIIEVNDTEIKYKKHSHIEGPIYTIQKNNVKSIKYENGNIESYLSSKLHKKKGFKPKYYKGEDQISKQEFYASLETNLNAYKKYKTGKTLNTIGMVTYSSSVVYCLTKVLINSANPKYNQTPTTLPGQPYNPYGTTYTYNEPEPALDTTTIIVSSAGAVGGIVLSIVGRANMKGAIKKYNAEKVSLNYLFSPNGIGLSMGF